jgi:hypothetical protein
VAKGFGQAQVKAIDNCVVIAVWMSEYGTLKYEWWQIFGPHHTFYIFLRSSFNDALHTNSAQLMQQVRSQGPAQVAIEYTYGTVETLTVSPLEPDLPQRNSSAACVVTQQYSSATFVSLSSVPQGKVHV